MEATDTKVMEFERNGRKVAIYARRFPTQYMFSAEVDGNREPYFATPRPAHHLSPSVRKAVESAGLYGGLGSPRVVGLSREQFDELERIGRELWESRPKTIHDLIREREQLSELVSLAEAAVAGIREAAWEREDERGTFQGPRLDVANEQVAESRRALKAFDASHPEVLDAIRADRAAAAARHQWD